MSAIYFSPVSQSPEFRDDVVECGECYALVLDTNTAEHANWHQRIGQTHP